MPSPENRGRILEPKEIARALGVQPKDVKSGLGGGPENKEEWYFELDNPLVSGVNTIVTIKPDDNRVELSLGHRRNDKYGGTVENFFGHHSIDVKAVEYRSVPLGVYFNTNEISYTVDAGGCVYSRPNPNSKS